MADRAFPTVLEGGSYVEGPRWHEGSWWVSDFYRHTVSRVAADGGGEDVVGTWSTSRPGLGWLPDGSMLAVSRKDQQLLRFAADGSVSTHADLSGVCAGRLTSLVVDTAGGRWSTTSG